jgi:hypothetical protein
MTFIEVAAVDEIPIRPTISRPFGCRSKAAPFQLMLRGNLSGFTLTWRFLYERCVIYCQKDIIAATLSVFQV